MLSPVSPHLLVPLLPLGTAPSTLVLGLAPGPRKYIQRFFDMKGIPEQGVKPPETLYPSIPTGLGLGRPWRKKPSYTGQGSNLGPIGHHASMHLTSARQDECAARCA